MLLKNEYGHSLNKSTKGYIYSLLKLYIDLVTKKNPELKDKKESGYRQLQSTCDKVGIVLPMSIIVNYLI